MKIRMLRLTNYKGIAFHPDGIYDIPENIGQRWVNRGLASTDLDPEKSITELLDLADSQKLQADSEFSTADAGKFKKVKNPPPKVTVVDIEDEEDEEVEMPASRNAEIAEATENALKADRITKSLKKAKSSKKKK